MSVPQTLEFIAAEPHHLDFLVALRNDPDSARYSKRGVLAPEIIAADYLHNEDKRAFVAMAQGKPAGYVIFEGHGDDREISLALAPSHRGQGLGVTLALQGGQFGLSLTGVRRIIAEVYPQNEASVKAFERAGYRRLNELNGERWRYVLATTS